MTINPDGSGEVRLTGDSPREDAYPTWSPGGRRIAFMSERVTRRIPPATSRSSS